MLLLRSRSLPFLCLLMLAASGCDKVQQAIEEQAGETAESVDPATPPAAPTEMAPAATVRTPQQIIDAFLALPSHERTDAHLQELTALEEGLEQITELNLATSSVTDAGFAGVKNLTALQSADLSKTRLTNAAFAALTDLPQLEELTLDGMVNVDGEALNTIKEVESLRTLKMTNTVIGDAALVSLAELPHLEVLHIDGVRNMAGRPFADAAKKGGFKELRELSFGGTQFGTYGLENVGSLKSLEVIRASGGEINDGSFLTIGACTNLRELHFQNNSFNPNSLKALIRLRNLEVLRLDGCNSILDPSFDILKSLKGLRELGLEGCPCTPAAVEQLKTKFLKETAIHYGGKTL